MAANGQQGRRTSRTVTHTPYGQRQAFTHGWLRADLDQNGIVHHDDEAIIFQQLSSGDPALPASPADLDADGDVDMDDYQVWEDTYFGPPGQTRVPQNDPLVTLPASQSFRDTSGGGSGGGNALNKIGHQGLPHDEESGLIYNRARMLHPTLGKFVQRDPLGYIDGMTAYRYYAAIHQSVDPSGTTQGIDFIEI